MTEIRNYDSAEEVAVAAAENAIEILTRAIEEKGSATWVLAGGTSPLAAYKKLAKDYADALDWSKVMLLMGDERFVPLDDSDSNWGTIIKIFDKNDYLMHVQRLAPRILESVEASARDYEQQIVAAGIEKFDLVWLGVGEDGHTLSLFPANPGFTEPTNQLIIAVQNSPKPPSERLTLSLKATEYIHELVIFAVGASKQDILRRARLKADVPVAVFASLTEENGGEVRWLYDDAAWGE